MHVCIIGGGIIGVASAYQLTKQGIHVTLIEAEHDVAMKASFANGGQLSYSYVAPLADPSVFVDLPKWLGRKDSPLKFTPQLSFSQWRWLSHFLMACRSSVQSASTQALLSLSFLSRKNIHHWLEHDGLSFHHQVNGKLIVHESQKSWDSARAQVEKQAKLGASQKLLNAEELFALEPAMEGMRGRAIGAVYTADEEVGDCHVLAKSMLEKLQQTSTFTLLTGVKVHGFKKSGSTVNAVHTTAGEIQADHFVVSSGVQSGSLLKPLGYSPLLFPLKGYSLTLDQENQSALFPKISVTDYARRIVYAPIGTQLRIAAMVDIKNFSNAVDPERIAILKNQIQGTFPQLNLSEAQPWAGLRPATPTSKPIIGACPNTQNVWMNIGHGALGFTLAAGSAQLLGEMLTNSALSVNPAPFAP
ncbi:FAD-dependent oxidoreductase [Alcaligenaceae bacterium 429]|nr:FAD-dependent oxidoreductase [Alcaligenaceae bacterium 429]